MKKNYNIFDKLRYIRSPRVILFSIATFVLVILLLLENIDRYKNKRCITDEVVYIDKSNHLNKTGNVMLYDLEIKIQDKKFVQTIVNPSEFKVIYNKLQSKDTITVCFLDNQIVSITSKTETIFDSNIDSSFLLVILIICIAIFAFSIYYLVKFKSDLLH